MPKKNLLLDELYDVKFSLYSTDTLVKNLGILLVVKERKLYFAELESLLNLCI